jgi:hypothetical protein
MENWSPWVALAALAVSIGTLVFKSGVGIGEHDSTAKDLERLEFEIQRLRDWRHRIGEDPAGYFVQALDVLADRVKRLEDKYK